MLIDSSQLRPTFQTSDGPTMTERIEPSVEQITTGIHKLNREYLECRTIGHAWMPSYVGPVAKSNDQDLKSRALHHPWHPDAVRVLICQRCHTERIDLCVVGYGRDTYSYRMVSRQYRYQDGYKVEGAHNHRELLHEELFRRST
jgi:hypothetical protein